MLRYVPIYATDFTNNEAGNSKVWLSHFWPEVECSYGVSRYVLSYAPELTNNEAVNSKCFIQAIH